MNWLKNANFWSKECKESIGWLQKGYQWDKDRDKENNK